MAEAASSRAFRAVRASELDSLSSRSMASSSSSTLSEPKPRSLSSIALRTICSICSRDRGLRANTRLRESRGETTSKDGFSVVAPMSTTVPFSTWGRTTSCCALLKRCISSTNRIVRWPCIPRRSLASAAIFLRSATPDATALIALKWLFVTLATSVASVVLPVPGGPHSMMDGTRSASMLSRRTRPGPMISSWPTNSSNDLGRIPRRQGRMSVELSPGAFLEQRHVTQSP